MIFRRRRLPTELQAPYAAFSAQVERLEAARGALMSCLPVGRVDPAPVTVGLELLADTMTEISAEMDIWKVAEVETEWHGCVAAIAESRAAMDHALDVADGSAELEAVLGAVEDVDEPLGYAFGQAERRWRSLRR